MSSSFQKFQIIRRLQSLKTADFKAKQQNKQRNKSMDQSLHQLTAKDQQPSQTQFLHLQQVVKKIKINSLVDQFIYKLKRNIVIKQPVQYQKIQQILTQMKSHQHYFKTIKLNDKLVAIFMIINIFAILLIQTLAAFQGFYLAYKQQDSRRPAIIIIQFVCLAVFFVKIVFSFFGSYSVNGVKQKYIRYVAKYYFFSWLFIFDFLNFIMTLLKVLFPDSQLTGILCFAVTALSLPVLSKNFEIIQIVFFNNYRKRQYFSIFKIFMFNIFFAQFVSSIMMAISYWDLQNNWIDKAIRNGNMAQGLTWWQTYFYSMYWAITTLTTIGYGDLTPANYFQVAFVGILMLIGTAVLSYNLSEIGSVISNLRGIDKRRKQQTVIFKRMSKDQKISQQLQTKILDYISKSAQVRAQFQFDERKKFLDDLPPQLKDQFQSEYSTNLFEKIPFFNLLDSSTLINLSMKLQGQIFYPGETITKKDGTLASIMFLKHGRIGFAYYKPGSILNGLVLQRRQIDRDKNSPYLLNKYLLTADRQINYQIGAENYCFLLTIQYEEFYEVLRQSRKDNQFYFCLYNKVSFIDQQWDQFQCKYCAPKRHTVFLCPKLHFMPYKSLIVQKQTFGPHISQQRKPIYRRKIYKMKQKTTLTYWQQFHKFVEVQFSSGYYKNQQRKNKIHEGQINHEDANNQMVFKITKEVLQAHCCQINEHFTRYKQMQIDQMHNFEHFFPQSNPQNLNMLNLKLFKRICKIPIRY